MNDHALYCDFCGKSQHYVAKLIAGPRVQICDKCVGMCSEILRAANNNDPNEVRHIAIDRGWEVIRELRDRLNTAEGMIAAVRGELHGRLGEDCLAEADDRPFRRVRGKILGTGCEVIGFVEALKELD
jgi:hypothetical protein